MAKNTKQMRLSFVIAALGYGSIVLLTCSIGIIILSINQNLNPNNIVMYILDQYSFDGLRGITLIGIMALVMSTADSWINTGAVIFAHDLCKPLGVKFKDELFISRVFSVFVGFGALGLVLFSESVFKLFVLQSSLYMPMVTIPLILAIFGFRSSGRAVMLGMGSGFLCVILWKVYIQPSTGVDAIVPAMILNLITLMSAHYLLREKGGWVGIKYDSDLKQIRNERKNSSFNFRKLWDQLCNINVLEYCNKHLPKDEITYIYFAFTVLITTITTTLLLERQLYQQYFTHVTILQIIALCMGLSFICRKMWSPNLKEKYIGIIWCLSIFSGLAFIPSFLALISKFSQLSMVILIFNLTIISLLIRWQAALFMIIFGAYLALASYELYIGSTPDVMQEL